MLWDKKKQNLLYVFEIPGGPKKGKFVVEINFSETIQRGDKTVRSSGNFVRSGGRVQADALIDKNTYEAVEGGVRILE